MESTKKKEEPAVQREALLVPLILWIAIGIVIGLGAYYLFFQPAQPAQPPANITVPSGPNITTPSVPNVSITLINYSDCAGCNSTDYLLGQIRSLATQFGFNIANVLVYEHNSSEAQSLISKYSIKRLPTLVVSKEANASSDFVTGWANIGSQESDGAFVYHDVYPPYYDLTDKKIIGFVEAIEISANCTKCYNTSQFVDFLAGENIAMAFSNRTVVDQNYSYAKSLISKYNITRLPAFLLSADASAYSFMNASWYQYGTVEQDGWHVYRGAIPPYVDLGKNSSVIGLVTLIELTEPNCTGCYDISLHYDGLTQSFGIEIDNRTSFDTNSTEGKGLISKYNITKVPTVIISNNAMLYPGFNSSWANMGTVESDGWLVFRELDDLGVEYKNVSITMNVSTNTTSGTVNASS